MGILINLLPIFLKMGIETIVVDPEPGFHPKTIGKSKEELESGLIALYEKMGLKKLGCRFRFAAFNLGLPLQLGDSHVDQYRVGLPKEKQGIPLYDQIIMIGSVKDMVDKIKNNTGMLGKLAAAAGNFDATTLFEFMKVPVKYDEKFKDNDFLTKDEFTAIKANEANMKNKYLKYKMKYIALKNQIIKN